MRRIYRDVCQQECNRDEHAREHDAKSCINLHQRPDVEAVRLLDGADELPSCEDPPRVAQESFVGPHANVDIGAQIVKVFEVGPCLCNPEGLNGEEREDKDAGAPRWEEGTNLQPGDDIVELVGDEEQGRSG